MLRVSKTLLGKTLQKVVAFSPKIKTASMSGVVLLQPEEDELRISVHYPEASIETFCPIAEVVGKEPDMALDGRKLLSTVSSAGVELRISVKDGSLVIGSDQAKWKFPMPRFLPKNLNLPAEPVCSFDVYELVTAVKTVKYAVNSDSVRPSLYMVSVKDGKVRACNGFQYHEVSTGISDLTFNIPGNLVDGFYAILRYFDGEVEFFVDDENYYFLNGDDLISIRKRQISFPDLERLMVRPLKAASPAILKVSKNDIVDAVRKVSMSLDEKYPYLEIHLTKKEALLRCVDTHGAESVATVTASWDTKPRVVTFNVVQLRNTLKSLPDGDVELRFGDDTKHKKSPMVCEGEGTWTMLNQALISPRK